MDNQTGLWAQQRGIPVQQPFIPNNYGMGSPQTQVTPTMPWNTPIMQPSLPNQPNVINSGGTNWRFVNGPDDVLPVEIPMNGAIGVFVDNNLSYVYLKKWNKQGGIDTDVYALVPKEPIINVEKEREVSPEFTQIMSRMDEIMEILQPQSSGNSSTKKIPKKEVTSNE